MTRPRTGGMRASTSLPLLRDSEVKFFFPYTTTLVEITINREPLPAAGVSDLLRFVRD